MTGSIHRKNERWCIGELVILAVWVMSVWFLEHVFTCNMKTDSLQRATGLANRVVRPAKMGVFNHALRLSGFHCYVLSLCESTESPKIPSVGQ